MNPQCPYQRGVTVVEIFRLCISCEICRHFTLPCITKDAEQPRSAVGIENKQLTK